MEASNISIVGPSERSGACQKPTGRLKSDDWAVRSESHHCFDHVSLASEHSDIRRRGSCTGPASMPGERPGLA